MFANFDAEEDFNTFSPAWNQPTKADEAAWDELDKLKETVKIFERGELKPMSETPAFLAYEKENPGHYAEQAEALRNAQGFSQSIRSTTGADAELGHYEHFLLGLEEDVLYVLDQDSAQPNGYATDWAHSIRGLREGAGRVSSPNYPSRERGRKLYAAKCRSIARLIEFVLNNAAECGPFTEGLVAEILAD